MRHRLRRRIAHDTTDGPSHLLVWHFRFLLFVTCLGEFRHRDGIARWRTALPPCSGCAERGERGGGQHGAAAALHFRRCAAAGGDGVRGLSRGSGRCWSLILLVLACVAAVAIISAVVATVAFCVVSRDPRRTSRTSRRRHRWRRALPAAVDGRVVVSGLFAHTVYVRGLGARPLPPAAWAPLWIQPRLRRHARLLTALAASIIVGLSCFMYIQPHAAASARASLWMVELLLPAINRRSAARVARGQPRRPPGTVAPRRAVPMRPIEDELCAICYDEPSPARRRESGGADQRRSRRSCLRTPRATSAATPEKKGLRDPQAPRW